MRFFGILEGHDILQAVALRIPSTIDIASELDTIVKAVTSDAVGGAGKLKPAKMPPKKPKKCGCKAADPSCKCEGEEEPEEEDGEVEEPELKTTKFVVDICKAEKQIVTGVVLKPETTDAQSDIYDSTVIEKAAFDFLGRFGQATKLGLQHNSFKDKENRFTLAESYVAPTDFVLGTKLVKAGSWVMSVRVNDPKIWKAVKEGKVTGFSIGGRAKVVNVAE